MFRMIAAPETGATTLDPPVASKAAAGPSRASWSGFLRLSLVVLPVKAYPAVSTTETLTFNQLHAHCGQRITYQKHCPVHGKVEGEAIVRGYQYSPGQYVVVEASELEQLRPARDKGLVLEQFISAEQLDPAMLAGRSLYLVPEGLPAHRPYLVLLEAMRMRGKWAIGRIAWSGQRQLVIVRPSGRLLTLHVLHDPAKVRSAAGLEGQVNASAASEEERQLACALIDSATAPVDWNRYQDDTAEKLTQLIEAKIHRRELVTPVEEPVQILQLLDALKQSVAAVASPAKKESTRSRKRQAAPQRRSA